MKREVRVLLVAAVAAMSAALLVGCGDSSADASSTASGDLPGGPAGMAAPGGPAADMASVFREALHALVDEGTITAEQEEAVFTAIAANRAERFQEGAPPDATGGQRPAPGMMLSSALDDLVDEGMITAEQREAVIEALTAAQR